MPELYYNLLSICFTLSFLYQARFPSFYSMFLDAKVFAAPVKL